MKDGLILHYSDKTLMQAHLNQMEVELKHFSAMRSHLWEVTEVGSEKMVNRETLPSMSYICGQPVNPYANLDYCNPERA
jgi:hypothetical protein